MKNKRGSGMTLIELVLAMALLTVALAAAGGALVAGTKAYRINYQMENDQYNTSMFLLEITRKIHMGVSGVEYKSLAGDGTDGELTLTDMDGNETTYEIVDGEVLKDGEPNGIRLRSFTVGFGVSSDGRPDGRITITATGEYGMELKTTVARYRIPVADTE